MKIRHTHVLAILILLAFVLAACGPGTVQPQAEIPTDTPAPLPPITEAETPDSEPEADPTEITDAPPEPTPAADSTIPMPELGFERGAPQLKASDLNQFVKAAGKPQLVELFAFW